MVEKSENTFAKEKGMGMNIFRIAICDDNIPMCSEIENSVMEYAKQENVLLSVEIYYTGDKLCNDLKNGIVYDLIFLDIELGSTCNGVNVGRFIRDELRNEAIQITYISSYKKYALDLFKVRPMDFLIKPITADMILGSLKTALRLSDKIAMTFQYKKGRDWNKVYIKDILYFKSNDREVDMITIKEKISFYGSLESIYDQLGQYHFFYAHKSFLVNYLHIREFSYDSLVMSNKEIIRIAQNRRKAVREIHKGYLIKEIEDAN